MTQHIQDTLHHLAEKNLRKMLMIVREPDTLARSFDKEELRVAVSDRGDYSWILSPI